MTMGTARELVDQWWVLFESGRFEELPSIVAPNAEVKMPGGMRLVGPAQVRPLLEAYRSAFPDIRHEIVDTIETEDGIALELHIVGTHTGDFMTPNGPLPPTGKRVVWESVDFVRIADGKIVSWHAYFDQMATAIQLGLVPAGAAG
jgi:steroid delta-isomerase-like uncharacterized protein